MTFTERDLVEKLADTMDRDNAREFVAEVLRDVRREAFRAGFQAGIIDDAVEATRKVRCGEPYAWRFHAMFNADLEVQAWNAWNRSR